MSALPIKLLEAGGCYDSQDLFIQCALTPAECALIDGSARYRTSRYLAANDLARHAICSRQEQIRDVKAMGRCKARTDKKICSSHPSACQLSAGFEPLDPTCTLTEDLAGTSLWAESYFGTCLYGDSGDSRPSHCAWSSDDCADGYSRFDWANPFFANAEPDCRCDDVPVGACVPSAESGLSTVAAREAELFCAASAAVCDEEEGYRYVPPALVESDWDRRCMLCDTLPPPPDERTVSAGYCAGPDGVSFQKCALIPADCPPGEEFVPASDIASTAVVTPTDAYKCATPLAVRSARVGRCDARSNNRMCGSDETACNLAQSFKPGDDQCSVAFDAANRDFFGGFTFYGFCSYANDAFGRFREDESVCVWRRRDCDSTDADAPPMFFNDASPGVSDSEPTCTCEMVRTGACVSSSNPLDRHCAVQEESCGDGYAFVGWRDLPSDLVCHLCEGLPDEAPEIKEFEEAVKAGAPTPGPPPTPRPSAFPRLRPTPRPVRAPDPQPSPSLPAARGQGQEGGLPLPALALIIVGTVAPVLLALMAFALHRRRARENDSRAAVQLRDMEPGQTEADLVPAEDHSVN